MIGFSYTYKQSDEILASVSHLSSLGWSDILLLVVLSLITIASIFVILPSCIIVYEYHKSELTKKNKKKLLSQILLQKEIEDEVEKEVKIEEQSQVL